MSMQLGTRSGIRTVQTGSVSAAKRAKGSAVPLSGPYERILSLYPLAPTGEVTPDEFETFAQERLICT